MSRAGLPLPDGRVALLFTDVQGSTALLHQLGTTYGDVLDEHDRILRGVWEEFDGVEVDNEGDAFFVAFADHQRAVDAVTAAQQRLAAAIWPDGVRLRVRMALHSGEPAIRGHKYWGVDVHYAARLGAAAHGGQVLLSADMRAQVPQAPVELLGTHGLKDFPAARQLFHLVLDGSRSADFPPPRTLTATRSNLPSIDTPIIGRDAVLADLRTRLLGDSHLVTLVGPGGMGKTRTAIAIGDQLVGEFPDGVAFVALATLRDVSEVPGAIAEALGSEIVRGADPHQALAALLRDTRALLVLDNAEHLPGLAPLVAGLLEAAGSRWLVTSRAPLNTRAETVVRLNPLEVPYEPGRSEDELESVAAVAMFLERVRARHSQFQISEAERPSLVRLCQTLEGVPLALELAAARAPVLGLTGLVDALDTDLDSALGTGPADLPARQRGLHATLDWTVALLTDSERDLYGTCAAFAQAWTIKEAEQMLADRLGAAQVWDALARLLDLSLVVQRGDGRFTMPERVRRHAGEVLSASGREHANRVRHAEIIRISLRRLYAERQGDWERAVAAMSDLTEETLHALAWSASHASESYRQLLAVAAWPLYTQGLIGPFVNDGVAFARSGRVPDLAQGYYYLNCTEGVFGGDLPLDERTAFAAEAIKCFEEHGDLSERLDAAMAKVDLLDELGDFAAAKAELATAGERARRAGATALLESMEDYNVRVDMDAGDFASAEARLHAIRADPQRHNYISNGAITFLGDCAFARSDFAAAIAYYAEQLRSVPSRQLVNMLLQVYASAAAYAGLGRDKEAAELFAAAAQTWASRSGQPWSAIALAWLEEPLVDAERRLSAEDLQAARRRGQALGYEELVARTLGLADELGA